MQLIYLFTSLVLLLLHLASVNVLLSRLFSLPYAISRALGVLLPVLGFFFVEHFVGLGRLQWLWPFSSVAALVVLYLYRQELSRQEWRSAELIFLACFAWGLLWKCSFASIYPTSERVTDLYFMQNYMAGDTLPPADYWLAGYRFNFYYAFQHYGAALMARWFGWDNGFAYNLAFVLLMSLGLSLAWEVLRYFLPEKSLEQKISRVLLILALALGGTGVAPLQRLIVTPELGAAAANQANTEMWASARFIGNYDLKANTEFGRKWFLPTPAQLPSADFQIRELPLENFGYQYYLGDYHPPLGGFFLLFLALAMIVQLQRLYSQKEQTGQASPAGQANAPSDAQSRMAKFYQAMLAACLPLMLISNTWIVPMLALLLGCYLGVKFLRGQTINYRAWLIGGVLGLMLIYPFLNYFSAQSLQTPIRWVGALDHTPLPGFLLTMWPLLILFALAASQFRREPLALALVAAFFLMLLVGEFLYVDDPSIGRFERTNTTMKWWGWMWSGGLLCCGAIALASGLRWQRRLAQLLMLALCSYALPTAQYFAQGGAAFSFKLNGKQWFTADAPVGNTIDYLANAKPGIVLENWQGDSYTNQTLYALFAGKPSLLGWPHHVNLWRNGAEMVWLRNQQLKDFYQASLNDPLGWLQQQQVRYIVWGRTELDAGKWQNINESISSRYAWRDFAGKNQPRVGIWELRDIP